LPTVGSVVERSEFIAVWPLQTLNQSAQDPPYRTPKNTSSNWGKRRKIDFLCRF
jgi:hypothetical protein